MKKILPITLAVLLANATYSQVTINGSDVNPSVGDATSTNNTAFTSAGSAGANQTWDFSSITSTGVSSSTYTASTTNGANIALNSGGNTVHLLQTASAQEYKTIVSGGTVITYSNGEKILQFPLSLSANFSDTFDATFSSGGYPAVRSGSNELMMDGYGTLMLPGQTLTDVIRVKLTQTYTDNIDIGTPYIINYETEVYVWYKAGIKEPLLSYSSIDAGGQVSEFGSYTGITNVGIESIEGINDVAILGNPFEGDVNFSIDATEQKEITYTIMDVTGSNVILTNQTSLSQGSNNISISMDDQAAGAYCLSITDGKKTINKLVIKK